MPVVGSMGKSLKHDPSQTNSVCSGCGCTSTSIAACSLKLEPVSGTVDTDGCGDCVASESVAGCRQIRTYVHTYLALLLNPHDPVNGTLVHQMGTLLHRTLLILKTPWGPPV